MSSVITTHFHVELTDGSIQRDISVLFVHVVVACSGLISQNNTESFNVVWSFFKDLVD